MLRYILFAGIICWVGISNAQFIDLDSLQAPGNYENVRNQKIYTDSLVSTFEIWVKKEVGLHKHEFHTEQVIVLEGEATMRLGEVWKTIKPGDLIIIPAGTKHEVIVTSSSPLKVISIQAPEFDGKDRVVINEGMKE